MLAPDKVQVVKELLKSIHRGASPEELKARYGDLLAAISPLEIVAVEQQLIREGVSINEILKLCDLHVALFRDYLASRELRGLPRGHPLEILLRENDEILRRAEALNAFAAAAASSGDPKEADARLEDLKAIAVRLRDVRIHYRKVQMALFPYLERRGIVAVPRVLWGREDQALLKVRRLLDELNKPNRDPAQVAKMAQEVAGELAELVFREDKILYPATYALFSEGEWAAIAEIFDDLGYMIEVGEREWRPSAKPVYPYELVAAVDESQLPRLPPEFRAVAQSAKPDAYDIRRAGDVVLETGFLSPEEIEGIFRMLPVEITFADANDRVRFFSESEVSGGFARAKTIVGRDLRYCHPPRLEGYVVKNVEALKKGEAKYRVFYTRQGGRLIRVIVAAVRGRDGKYIGTLEVVEDITELVENAEEVKKKVVVL
ncbi:MAG: DUF438 domain-containing protein [Desulfurococcaceae archaeon]